MASTVFSLPTVAWLMLDSCFTESCCTCSGSLRQAERTPCRPSLTVSAFWQLLLAGSVLLLPCMEREGIERRCG